MGLKNDLKQQINLTGQDIPRSREKYAEDHSIFTVEPALIIFPKEPKDIQQLVRYVAAQKENNPELSITVCGGRTNFSGAAINNSILLDLTKHMAKIYTIGKKTARLQAGAQLDAIKKQTDAQKRTYIGAHITTPRATIGGAVAMNASDSSSLQLGDMSQCVSQLKVILADGNQYTIKPLTKKQFSAKITEDTFEGRLYKKIAALLTQYQIRINNSRPRTTRYNGGYNVWDITNDRYFDLTKLFIGAEGTLGIITEVTIKLSPTPQHTKKFSLLLHDSSRLDDFIASLRELDPAKITSLDYPTGAQLLRSPKEFISTAGAMTILKASARLPITSNQMLIEVQLQATTETALKTKEQQLKTICKTNQATIPNSLPAAPIIHLMQQKLENREFCPLTSDIAVPIHHLAVFLPQLKAVIHQYRLPLVVGGDIGNGQFWLFPLRRLSSAHYSTIQIAMREIYKLVLQYNGTLGIETGDGMLCGPWLEQQYGPTMYRLFQKVKNICDPDGIFNPYKKTEAKKKWNDSHLNTH